MYIWKKYLSTSTNTTVWKYSVVLHSMCYFSKRTKVFAEKRTYVEKVKVLIQSNILYIMLYHGSIITHRLMYIKPEVEEVLEYK